MNTNVSNLSSKLILCSLVILVSQTGFIEKTISNEIPVLVKYWPYTYILKYWPLK